MTTRQGKVNPGFWAVVLKASLLDLIYFTLGSSLGFLVAWLVTQRSLGGAAAKLYFAPVTHAFGQWFLWSILLSCLLFFCFRWIPALLRETAAQSRFPNPSDTADVNPPSTSARPTGKLLTWLISVGLFLGISGILVQRVFLEGSLIQSVSFPGTAYPQIEIRRTGFLRSSLYAYVVGPLYKQAVFWIHWNGNLPAPMVSAPKTGHGQIIDGDRTDLEPYGIVWSVTGRRFAIFSGEFYVGAYDLDIAAKIEQNGKDINQAVTDFLEGK